MKRIFLTSGLVLCMACPAFAASWDNATSGTQATGCTEPNLGVFSGPTTLRAIWNAQSYSLTYNPGTPATTAQGQSNNVTGMPDPLSSNITFDAPVTTAAAPSLTGYSFNGWKTDTILYQGGTADEVFGANDSTTIDHYKATTPATLTAQWTPLQYNVIYNTTTHSNAYGTQNASYTHTNGATYDADYALPQSTDAIYSDVAAISASKTGYSFVGWTTSSSPAVTRDTGIGTTPVNTGTVANAWTGETPWRRTADLNVYAAYIANQYNITYSCTGGEGGASTAPATGTAPATQLVTFDQTFTLAANLSSNGCALDGYDFAGWDCPNLPGYTANDNGLYLVDGATASAATGYTYAGDVACTAKWTPKSIGTITWNDNGATTPHVGGDTSCTYDEAIVLPTAPEKTGYTFGGWEVQ